MYYFWLPWVFIAAQTLSSCSKWGLLSSWGCMGFSQHWILLFRSTGSRVHGPGVVVAHGLSSCDPPLPRMTAALELKDACYLEEKL